VSRLQDDAEDDDDEEEEEESSEQEEVAEDWRSLQALPVRVPRAHSAHERSMKREADKAAAAGVERARPGHLVVNALQWFQCVGVRRTLSSAAAPGRAVLGAELGHWWQE
jgi:hypothetical protein